MKKATFAAVAFLLAVPSVGMAQGMTGPDSGWYVGGNLGQSDFKEAGEKDTAFKVLGGYQINRNWGAEVGYTDFGKVTASGVDLKGNALELVGVGTLPINDKFSVYGKAGFARGEIKATGSSDDSVELTYGIGVQYNFSPVFGIRGEWQKYPDVGNGATDVDVMSVGVVYRFR
jgi:OOP family OmpA-OmpF porin